MRTAVGTAWERTVQYYYDTRGDLIAFDPPGGPAGRVQFEYVQYEQGSPPARTIPAVYVGKLTRIRYPDGTSEYFGYNGQEELDWRVAGDGQVTTLARDELHRVREITYPATAGYPGWTVTVTRDEFGRATSSQGPNGISSVVYDDLNRVVSANPAVGQSVTYQYLKDLPLQRAIGRVTLAGVGTWEFREDGKGREAQVLNPFNQLTTRYFDPDSKLLREVRANGTYSDYAYTPRDWLGGIEHRLAGGGLLDTLNYFYTDGNGVYDPTGHLRREVDSLNRTHAFFYNPNYELTAEQHPDFGTIEYFLDPNGNRTAKRWNGAVTEYYGVDAQNKLLWTNQAGNFAPTSGQAAPYRLFQYDLAGQPTVKEMREVGGGPVISDGLAWDGMGKMRRIVDLATTLERYSATYDSGGIRATSRLAGVDHVFSGGAGLLHDTAGATIYTPGVSQRKNGEDRWFHEDWLRSSRFLSDGTGTNVPTGYRYDAFGAQTANMGPDATSLKFAGGWEYQSDVAGGLQLLGHRLYDPGLARFISPDPIGFAGGWNLYNYVGHDPVNATDSLGLAEDPRKGDKLKSQTIAIVLNTFIPSNNVAMGLPPWSWARGDSRGFRSNGGSYRTEQWVILDPRNPSSLSTRGRCGESSIAPNWLWNPPPLQAGPEALTTTVVPQAGGGWQVTFSGNPKDPQFWSAITPGLTYDFTLFVSPDGKAQVVSKNHDNYPAYEIWAYPFTHAASPVYRQKPRGGLGAFWLARPQPGNFTAVGGRK